MATSAITETPNELTAELGSASPIGIVRLLRQVDAQMFAGWQQYPGLLDQPCLETMATVARTAAELMADPGNSAIVLAGCGTSGRIGFIVARAFNRVMEAAGLHPCFHYLCAGGDPALFTSYEAPEDNVAAGREALEAASAGKTRVLYVGITCGLSAPYVAGQLDYANQHRDTITPVLVGFNPLERARTVPIEGWTKTFAGVLAELDDHPGFAAVVPVVGPEALTGSTRMKGGSATKIILEAMFAVAYRSVADASGKHPAAEIAADTIAATVLEYDAAVRHTYCQADGIAAMVAMAGASLRESGRLIYLGFSSYGVAGLIDASECPPTYNAGWEEIRAYLFGGYGALRNQEGNLSARGNQYRLDPDGYDNDTAPSLTSSDSVVFIVGTHKNHDAAEVAAKARAAQARGAKVGLISIAGQGLSVTVADRVEWDSVVDVALPKLALAALYDAGGVAEDDGEGCFLAEMAVKLVLNAVTTGGHIIKGKILSNRMVDLQVSNNKLFYRSIGIVRKFSNTGDATSRLALLRSLHRTDEVGAEIEGLGISAHIRASGECVAQGIRVVPTAIILATKPSLTFAEASAVLAAEPQLGAALGEL